MDKDGENADEVADAIENIKRLSTNMIIHLTVVGSALRRAMQNGDRCDDVIRDSFGGNELHAQIALNLFDAMNELHAKGLGTRAAAERLKQEGWLDKVMSISLEQFERFYQNSE